MPSDLSITAAKLLQDVERISADYDACHEVIEREKGRWKDRGPQFTADIKTALWAELKFEGDWQKFDDWLHQAVEAFIGRPNVDEPGDRSQMWIFSSPAKEDPNSEVDRILDRIDIALHLVAKEVGMELPFKTIRVSGWEIRRDLSRVVAFVQGLNDVVDPSGNSKAALQY